MKKIKAPKVAHTSNSKVGMGDFYGTGVKNKVGTTPEIRHKMAKKLKKVTLA